MKIGIFGDSYANHYVGNTPEKSWVNYLEDKYNITNYAEPGSSLYFSVEKFLEHHEKYDKIIFCITDRERIYLPEYSCFLHKTKQGLKKSRHLQFNFLDSFADRIKKYNSSISNTNHTLKIIQIAKDYYEHVYNDDANNLFYKLMIKEIKSLRTDGLFFDENLWQISRLELEHYQIEKILGKKWYETHTDYRSCHLTETNNLNLFNVVDGWLQNLNFEISNLFKPPIEPLERYFRKNTQ